MTSPTPQKPAPRILLVDDDVILREIAETNLTEDGYKVTTASDGREAWQWLQQARFDMVVSDLEMPVMDGLALIREIRASETLHTMPVLMITGKDKTVSVDEAFAAGATSFLAKPLNWKLFSRSVKFVYEAAKQEEALRVAKEQAETAAKLKQAILSNMNHEMRTPLNHIIGFAELLSNKFAQEGIEDDKQYTDFILDGGRRLLRLVSDMVFLSVAEAEGVTLDESTCSPRQLVEDALSGCRKTAGEKSISLQVGDGGRGYRLTADSKQLILAIDKIVDNAIKFSPDGRHVAAGFTVHEASGAGIFYVQDQGPGVDETRLATLGELFTQQDMEWSRAQEGMGTGLRVCSHIVRAHGGKVQFANGEDGGLTVTIMLPASRVTLREERLSA